MEEGELEIGQVAAAVRSIQPAGDIVRQVWEEFRQAQRRIAVMEV